jgi:uncharacterized protein
MDPATIFFGLGIGLLVGMTGMGGGSLMTPLMILVLGVQPVTAIGTDIFYAAVTKTVGGWRHLRMRTVNLGLSFWLAVGSVPAAILGVWAIEILQSNFGEDSLNSIVYSILGATLLVVGLITLGRALVLTGLIQERDHFDIKRHHKAAAIIIGATTGFIIGLTSAGSGTVIAILLIAVFRLSPHRVVGTDIFHAAVLLWAAGLAHIVGGNVDFGLAGNILVGSVPGVIVGSQLSARAPQGMLRTALGVVLVASGVTMLTKADGDIWPFAAGIAATGFGFLIWGQHHWQTRRGREAAGEYTPEPTARGVPEPTA